MIDQLAPTREVTYVYLGDSVPEYAKASLHLAHRHSGMKIKFLGNGIQSKEIASLKFVDFVAIEDFYDPSDALDAKKFLLSSDSFRQGFWFKTLERFFVLYQFANFARMDHFFHAELDQLLFRTDLLYNNILVSERKGVFLPFRDPSSAVASVFVCNHLESLKSLLSFSVSGSYFSNEMELLGEWSRINRNLVFGLPTPGHITLPTNYDSPISFLSVTDLDGVLDAAQMGQWVAGMDPRNVRITSIPRNKVQSSYNEFMLRNERLPDLTMSLDDLGRLFIRDNRCPETSFAMYNLHLHSKVHSTILNAREGLGYLFSISNQRVPVNIPGTKSIQRRDYIKSRMGIVSVDRSYMVRRLVSKFFAISRWRPSSYPLVSGDAFKKLANHVWGASNASLDPQSIRAGDIIFCEADFAEDLNGFLNSSVGVPTVILLGNSDRNFSLGQAPLFQTHHRVFAQNLYDQIANYQVLPIGVENLHLMQNGFISLNSITTQGEVKKMRILWSFSISTNRLVRTKAANDLRQVCLADNHIDRTPKEHQRSLRRYGFVACPPGNGIDTHRMWEALYFRAIPIVLRSWMTTYYENIGLPVLVVNSYGDLAQLSSDDLHETYKRLSDGFNNPRLWMKFWNNEIRQVSEELGCPRNFRSKNFQI